ncbi:hypothetical protein [Vibrio nigripulchritudo]|nr:hypothetical protein [Vibrio nigripulchritudo]
MLTLPALTASISSSNASGQARSAGRKELAAPASKVTGVII